VEYEHTLSRGLLRAALIALTAALLATAAIVGSRSAFASGPAPGITCDAAAAVYGESVTCTTVGSEVVGVRWPDGHASASSVASHTPRIVGMVGIDAVDDDGNVLVSTLLELTPDIELQCEDGDRKPVYQLAKSSQRPEGWDYVYAVPNTGRIVRPGDAEHPYGSIASELERIELEQVVATRFCQIHSQAVHDLDGEYRVTLVSPWEDTRSHPVNMIDPASKTRWSGAQPAELTGTVTVNGVQASERRGVYMSSCN